MQSYDNVIPAVHVHSQMDESYLSHLDEMMTFLFRTSLDHTVEHMMETGFTRYPYSSNQSGGSSHGQENLLLGMEDPSTDIHTSPPSRGLIQAQADALSDTPDNYWPPRVRRDSRNRRAIPKPAGGASRVCAVPDDPGYSLWLEILDTCLSQDPFILQYSVV